MCVQELKVVKRLSDLMEVDGVEMYIFRYVMGPLFKNGLPKNKRLLLLYHDHIYPIYGKAQALAYLWFGVNVSGICDESNNPISNLFESDTTLDIRDGEVLYRRLLADVARKLAKTADSEAFIQYVASTVEGWSNPPNAEKFMPPEEEEHNSNVFVPHLIELFREADSQWLIEPPNVTHLIEWLIRNGFNKIARDVKKFRHEEPFRKECKRGVPKVLKKIMFSYSYSL